MRLRGRTFAIGLLATLALAACGSGGDDKGSTSSANAGGLEKTTISVSTSAIADHSALYIAQKRGFFKEVGLTVKTEITPSTAATIPRLMNGSLDVAALAYFSIFSSQEAKAGDWRVVADAYQAGPDVIDLVVPKDSPIKTVKDLEGKRVSIASRNSVGELAVGATLKTAGLDPAKSVQWVGMAFPEMPAKLLAGEIDAAWLPEPFLTNIQRESGARVLADTMSGALADFPIAGWAATSDWTKKYPKTMAAFQRAILKGQQVAASDRKAVEGVLPDYTAIKPDVAGVMKLGVFPTSLNATRLQRVADTMQEYGFLKGKLDVAPLLVPLPQ
ncbi:sulfonate ABC transporter substrate-binding protein [Sphaerisporangium melleum]|uniref:Sulfonate ABC transporter substrate-binding protein n=1 Tax=Sphaerisporangium melleum TaxID=321316 RepID=A0A917VWK0_9ACTN|nr:ABC transporter substrate-binding protein [Sphaerisporangium melleum]GGL21665.1 sulfonate ABC transporter substrate-binding protein [Sphaerisporangium melleum]GII71564.1 sulfonate ABC transporter substrate-binding protein [Sphaerisporangium melleum]